MLSMPWLSIGADQRVPRSAQNAPYQFGPGKAPGPNLAAAAAQRLFQEQAVDYQSCADLADRRGAGSAQTDGAQHRLMPGPVAVL